jgi:hypothetical protein
MIAGDYKFSKPVLSSILETNFLSPIFRRVTNYLRRTTFV